MIIRNKSNAASTRALLLGVSVAAIAVGVWRLAKADGYTHFGQSWQLLPIMGLAFLVWDCWTLGLRPLPRRFVASSIHIGGLLAFVGLITMVTGATKTGTLVTTKQSTHVLLAGLAILFVAVIIKKIFFKRFDLEEMVYGKKSNKEVEVTR